MPQPHISTCNGKVYTHDLVHGVREAFPKSIPLTERDVLAKALWLERNGQLEKAEDLLDWFLRRTGT